MTLRSLVVLIATALTLSAQVAVSPYGKPQYFDANGKPLSGGFLYTYAAGTTQLQATYTDSTGHVANQDPIPLDSSGSPPSGIFLSAGAGYKFTLTDSLGNTRWTLDGIIAPSSALNGSLTVPAGGALTVQSGATTSFAANLLPDASNVRSIGTASNLWSGGYFGSVTAANGFFTGISASSGPNTLNGTTSINGSLQFASGVGPYQIQCAIGSNCGINNTLLIGQTATDIPIAASSLVVAGEVYAATSQTNASYTALLTSPASFGGIAVSRSGSGTYLPLAFFTNNTEQMSIDTGGNLTLINGTANFPSGVLIASPSGHPATSIQLNNAFVQPAQTLFATLGAFGAPRSGSILWCIDCLIGNICSGPGTGALAVFTGSVWTCK